MESEALIRNLIASTRKRAFRELLACLIIFLAGGAMLLVVRMPRPESFGWLTLMFSAIGIAVMVWRHTLGEKLLRLHPPSQTAFWTMTFLAQARLLRWVPLWYLAPLLLGIVLINFPAPGHRWNFLQFIMIVVISAILSWQNRKAAKGLELQARRLA